MRLADLTPGQRFHHPALGVDGTLLSLSPVCATVEVERLRERSFRTEDGKLVRFTSRTERTTWSHGTEVVPR